MPYLLARTLCITIKFLSNGRFLQNNFVYCNYLSTFAKTVDYVGNDRYVFNIHGNQFRLVVLILMVRQKVYVRWVGRHKDYDKIDCSTI